MAKELVFLIKPSPSDRYLLVYETDDDEPQDWVVQSFPTKEGADHWLNIKGSRHYLVDKHEGTLH